jgi:hypothetical protein
VGLTEKERAPNKPYRGRLDARSAKQNLINISIENLPTTKVLFMHL